MLTYKQASQPGIRRVTFVAPGSPAYREFLRRMRELHPGHGGPRDPGERIGGMAEQAVRLWLSRCLPLDEGRILSWQDPESGRARYQEIDAVHRMGEREVCLFEVKATTPEAMRRRCGIRQLNSAAEILRTGGHWRTVRRRLVYIGDVPPQDAGPALPAVAPAELGADLGVIWVSRAEVEAAARTLGLPLPANWHDPVVRGGGTPPPPAANPTAPFNPLSEALERALGRAPSAYPPR